MKSSVKVEIFGRHSNGVRKSEPLHTESFLGLAKAQKFCKGWMRGRGCKLCNYFFHITGEDGGAWFTLSGGELVEVQDLKVTDDVIFQKEEELAAIKAQIAEVAAQCAVLQSETAEIYRAVLEKRAEYSALRDQLTCEQRSRSGGFLAAMKYYNTPDRNGRRPLDKDPEPGSLLAGYREWAANTPNPGYTGRYVTISMGDCGSGRHDPNTGKYNPYPYGR